MGYFAWHLSLGDFGLRNVTWRLSLGDLRSGTLVWDLPLGSFRLGTFAWALSFWKCGSSISALGNPGKIRHELAPPCSSSSEPTKHKSCGTCELDSEETSSEKARPNPPAHPPACASLSEESHKLGITEGLQMRITIALSAIPFWNSVAIRFRLSFPAATSCQSRPRQDSFCAQPKCWLWDMSLGIFRVVTFA